LKRKLVNRPVSTIHSRLYQPNGQVSDGKGGFQPVFKRRPLNLRGQVLVVDESSMVNADLADALIATGAQIVTFGDVGQLQPVEGKRYFDQPDFTLREIRRQAKDSPIIRQAYRVREGLSYESDGQGVQIIEGSITEDALVAIGADVVLVHANDTRHAMNTCIRQRRGLPDYPTAGEMIMCRRNNSYWGVINGDSYRLLEPFTPGQSRIALSIEGHRAEVAAEFEGIEATPALDGRWRPVTQVPFGYSYCLTVHKAQGSEWEHVLVIDDYPVSSDQRPQWLYTAITRAKPRVTILRGRITPATQEAPAGRRTISQIRARLAGGVA
jgi:exodeoxyribonuclease-5